MEYVCGLESLEVGTHKQHVNMKLEPCSAITVKPALNFLACGQEL